MPRTQHVLESKFDEKRALQKRRKRTRDADAQDEDDDEDEQVENGGDATEDVGTSRHHRPAVGVPASSAAGASSSSGSSARDKQAARSSVGGPAKRKQAKAN